MIRHFFLDKTNTIIEGNRFNYGLNPILSLGYGKNLMRGLIHFDMEEIKNLINDKTFANIDKLKFNLKMTNCFSVAGVPYESELIKSVSDSGERASSCDVILFELPCDFDGGRGFDFISDFWVHNSSSYSKEGSTWYSSKSHLPWSNTFIENYNPKDDPGGIYSNEKLTLEYNKFKKNEDSIIVGEQHFDFGDENLSIDITKYIFKCIETNTNYGLCLAFSPYYENCETEKIQCLDFFNDHTNTFFHPFVEAVYSEYIEDRREMFVNNDKIYLYVYNDGILSNLDKLPICKINDQEVEVKQSTKGVYYAQISKEKLNIEEESMCYDIWSEIVLNGEKYDDVEMEFFVNNKTRKISIGNNASIKQNVIPNIYGINDAEVLSQNEIREVIVDFQEKFSTDKKHLITSAKYRLYVKDGNREIDIIDYHPIELANNNNYFLIHTMDLIPNNYYVDISVSTGREFMQFKNVLRFEIVSNITERYQ